jgi:hypothetical protein
MVGSQELQIPMLFWPAVLSNVVSTCFCSRMLGFGMTKPQTCLYELL